MTAPEESVTVPVSVAPETWAPANTGRIAKANTQRKTARPLEVFPELRVRTISPHFVRVNATVSYSPLFQGATNLLLEQALRHFRRLPMET